jgi:hypothetical protein
MSDFLARQHTDTQGGAWSIKRDNQLRSQLEASLHALQGRGIVSGGRLTQTAAWTVEIEEGTQVFDHGVLYTLPAAVSGSGTYPGTTVYVWGKLARTAGFPAVGTSDTYAFTLEVTDSDEPTDEDSFLVAVGEADGSGITSLEDAVADKLLRAASPLRQGKMEVPAGAFDAVPAGEQLLVSKVKFSGRVKIEGRLKFV